jgi:hypothetical protein
MLKTIYIILFIKKFYCYLEYIGIYQYDKFKCTCTCTCTCVSIIKKKQLDNKCVSLVNKIYFYLL